ncbi:MAG: sialate O-acetylesterase [Verrucomicrobiaceae bacterium]|nr:sialate O-acetylesterase [Verrucomicrobiaceae bacterium]
MRHKKAVLTILAALWLSPTSLTGAPQVNVFILAGQSNMEGAGKINGDPKRNGGKGSLSHMASDDELKKHYGHLRDNEGNWLKRDDVMIWYLGRKGKLEPGYGARQGTIGPELGFGHAIGDALSSPVLLIKTAWGGKSLAKDFRPPSSKGATGSYYLQMLNHVRDVLQDVETLFPALEDHEFRIAGFAWHQGWNDGCSMPMTLEYEHNLANLIRDIRKDLKADKLPFVIADSGFGGPKQKVDRRLKIRAAQAAPAAYREFKGTVECIKTAPFFRPPEESPSGQGYHWNGNAETYYLIGQAMGKAMLRLINQAD